MEADPTSTAQSLSDEHMSELNGFCTVPQELRQARYAALREQYSDKPYALEQIDVFDASSPYGIARQEYVDAIKSGNTERERELVAWFGEHYPLLESRHA